MTSQDELRDRIAEIVNAALVAWNTDMDTQYSEGEYTAQAIIDELRTDEEFDRFLQKVRAEAWDEGASDGQWNLEHEGQIERGTRSPITNPYRENGDNNE